MQHPENKDQKGKSENYICAKLHSCRIHPTPFLAFPVYVFLNPNIFTKFEKPPVTS